MAKEHNSPSEATARPWRHIHKTIYAEREVTRPMAQRSSTVAVAELNAGLDQAEANAELIVRAVNRFNDFIVALEKINTLACYASEENTDARESCLLEIGTTARAALALADGSTQEKVGV